MASGIDDVNEGVDDVIQKLDLTQLRTKDGSTENGERENKESPVDDITGSLGDNTKLLPGGKGHDTSGSRANGNGVAKGDGVAKGNGFGSYGKDDTRKSKLCEQWKVLKDVKVDSLPQRFVCKYVGSKPCTGLWGVRHTRHPVDQMITELRELPEGDDLPLVNVKVSAEGLKAALHDHSKSSRPLPDSCLLPLQFISYAVQDPRYTRVFVFILVREMSSRERKTECHAYLCSSDVIARQMALSMAMAFGEFSRKLEGKQHRFQVDLRHTEELETELSASSPGTEFDA